MKRYDLIVVGGGISGVAAAVSAGREGLSTLIIESSGCFGGAMTGSLVYPFMGYGVRGCPGKLTCEGIFTEMRERQAAYNDPSRESYKLVFDDMINEAGVETLFHSTVFEVITEERKIRAVKVATVGGVMEFEADLFIDASGDGALIALAGCEFLLGRESDGYCQPMTTCFRMAGVDVKGFWDGEAELNAKYKEYQKDGRISNPRENLLFFSGPGEGIMHFNTTRVIKHDPTDPFALSRAEMLARRQVMEMVDFFKKESPAMANATLVSIANHIGVRESRKLVGVHVLTADEMKSCYEFEDTIALGAYDIDIHNPTGSGTYIYSFGKGEYYRIPYRSLLPKEYDNMLVAGRCLSADHEAHSSVRIMPICACLGEAAGVAAALCKRCGVITTELDTKLLRSKLLEKGAAL